jgi:hypothetical protein
MRCSLALALLFLFAYPVLCQAQEKKKEADPQANYVKLEVRGVLHVKGGPAKIPELETVFGGRQWGMHWQNFLPSIPNTGVSIVAEQVGAIDVYLGDDKELHELAKKHNGKVVVLSGDFRMIGEFQKGPSPTFGQPEGQRLEFRYTVVRPFVRASNIKAGDR